MKRKLCIEVGKAIAIHMFVDMLNPKYRGSKFRWENFPAMVDKLARTSLFAHFPNGDPTQKERDLAGETARKWAEKSIKRAGLVDV